MRDFKAQAKKEAIIRSSLGYYQVLFVELRLANSGARFYGMIFIARRAILVLVVFHLKHLPWLQAFIFIALSMLKLLYIA